MLKTLKLHFRLNFFDELQINIYAKVFTRISFSNHILSPNTSSSGFLVSVNSTVIYMPSFLCLIVYHIPHQVHQQILLKYHTNLTISCLRHCYDPMPSHHYPQNMVEVPHLIPCFYFKSFLHIYSHSNPIKTLKLIIPCLRTFCSFP